MKKISLLSILIYCYLSSCSNGQKNAYSDDSGINDSLRIENLKQKRADSISAIRKKIENTEGNKSIYP